jgi:putative transcriptional regulator
MLRCYLSRLMGDRKMKVVDVVRATGLHRNSVTLLYQEKFTRIEAEAIEKLCALFGCTVGELFEFIPDAAQSDRTKKAAAPRAKK